MIRLSDVDLTRGVTPASLAVVVGPGRQPDA